VIVSAPRSFVICVLVVVLGRVLTAQDGGLHVLVFFRIDVASNRRSYIQTQLVQQVSPWTIDLRQRLQHCRLPLHNPAVWLEEIPPERLLHWCG
jgi:hypothetical protein